MGPIRIQLQEFLISHGPQGNQTVPCGLPDQRLIYGLILMPIDVPSGGDRYPIDLRMALDHIIGEPPPGVEGEPFYDT